MSTVAEILAKKNLTNLIFNEPIDTNRGSFTELRNELPLTRITLKNGENLVGLPFNLDSRDDYNKIFPPSVYREMGVTYIEQIFQGTRQVSFLGDTGDWTGTQPTFEPKAGYLIHCDEKIAIQRGGTKGGGDIYIYADIESGIHSISIGGSNVKNLVPYASLKRQYVKDAIKSTTAVEIYDTDSHIFWDSGTSSWKGNLKDFEIGKAYWMKKSSAGNGTFQLYDHMVDEQVMSNLYYPSYINDIPRPHSEDSENWLYNKYHGMYRDFNSADYQCKVMWPRAYNWDDQYIIGHRIKFVRKDSSGNYLYQPLPVGNNDWIIAFINYKDILSVVGATKQNDVKMGNLLSSPTKIDVDKWDPYNNTDHKALLGNPEDYAGSGTTYGKGIQAVCHIRGRSGYSDNEPDHYLTSVGQTGSNYENIYFLYYDSTKAKYYWLYETDNKILVNPTRAEQGVTIWWNVYDNGSFGGNSQSKELRAVKGQVK